jgi:hypothetical protein
MGTAVPYTAIEARMKCPGARLVFLLVGLTIQVTASAVLS